MTRFRMFLAAIFLAVVLYTVPVVASHGMGLLQIFFGDIAAMTWPGQFNVDFLGMLLLSGLWLAWRHHFSPGGLVLGMLGVFGGAPLLTGYLLVASFKVRGDIAALLLGEGRALRLRSGSGG